MGSCEQKQRKFEEAKGDLAEIINSVRDLEVYKLAFSAAMEIFSNYERLSS